MNLTYLKYSVLILKAIFLIGMSSLLNYCNSDSIKGYETYKEFDEFNLQGEGKLIDGESVSGYISLKKNK